jgi:hypothetical protein
MASTVKDSEQAALAPSPPAKLRPAELVLRLLLFAASLSGLVVLVTGKQTAIVPVVLTPPFRFGPVAAEFTNSPALMYVTLHIYSS